jgi:heme-degrading monooxygenase HmoA
MYATVRVYDSAEGLADAVAQNRAEILGLFEDIPGFRGYHIVKTGPASCVSVTVFDDQAGAEASNQAAREWIAGNLANASISPPQVHAGEVAMSADG